MLSCLASQGQSADLKSDERILFFPTFAPLGPSPAAGAEKRIELPIHGWVFEPVGTGITRRTALSALGDLLELNAVERQLPLFFVRAERFLVDNERGKTPIIRVRDKPYPLAATTSDGHTTSTIVISGPAEDFADRQSIEYQLRTKTGDKRTFAGRVQLIGAKGVSVVSDIDDTIKFSNVLEKRELIRNTFLRPFKPIEGMSDVYQTWETKGAVFHYVSGSPWQLYEPLADFRAQEKFPLGSFHLRKFRIKDRSATTFLAAPEEYKIQTIEPILEAFPERRFILVGDSGERDPEAYGELARRRPKQIAKIAIRNITDATLVDERMKAAFHEVDAKRVVLFRDASELSTISIDD